MAKVSVESSTTLHQEALADFILVRTDQIDEGDRLRQIDPAWASALGQMMARDGQDTPIQICRLPGRDRWTLVAGGHRHAGAILEGIEFLRAEVVNADRDDRRLREARENVMRSGLTPVDRAAHVAEIVAIMKRRAGIDPTVDGRVASVAARWQKAVKDEAADTTATIAVVYGFTDAVAEELGLSARTVENDLMLYRRLAPSLIEALREVRHPVLRNASQLRTLAKLDPELQADVLAALVGDGWEPCKTVAEAISRTQPARPDKASDPAAKRLSTFIDTFSRMTVIEKKGALELLRGMLPPGTTLTNVEQRPARPAAMQAAIREQTLAAIDTMREVVDGLVEDEVIPGERGADLQHAADELRLARMTIAGGGFELSVAA